MTTAGLRALADAARALAAIAEAAAEESSDAMIPEREAARIAGVTLYALRKARRDGALVFYGGQRNRVVRRSALEAWLETRRAPALGKAPRPRAGPVVRDELDESGVEDVERRARRRERSRA